MSSERGILRVVATPIGNLEDITLRALRVLREAELILAEDTRHSRKLLDKHNITTQLRSFHAHSTEGDIDRVVRELKEGRSYALISDAGSPLISDPGAELVSRLAAEGIAVEAIPGPSAVITALSVAGVRVDDFRFVGFLPRTGSKRRTFLERLAQDSSTTVIFEAGNRTADTLKDLAQFCGSKRRAAVARELTKMHEEILRGPLSELAEIPSENFRGEITIVVEGQMEREEVEALSPAEIDAFALARFAAGISVRDVARELTGAFGLSRKDAYERALLLGKNADDQT